MSNPIWRSPNLIPPPEELLCTPPDGCSLIRLFKILPKFVSGDKQSERIRLRYFTDPARSALWANAWYGQGAEGPPGHAHGGSMASVLDEAMGGIAWIRDHQCLALEINVKFRKALPLGSLVRVKSWLERVDGKKIYSRAEMTGASGELYSESSGLFLEFTCNITILGHPNDHGTKDDRRQYHNKTFKEFFRLSMETPSKSLEEK